MWIIEYGDERGNQSSNRYATAAEALTGLENMGKASSAMTEQIDRAQVDEGYSLQTHSFHAYSEEWGNHTISVTDLDTHDENGYELIEGSEDDAFDMHADPLENKTESFTLEATEVVVGDVYTRAQLVIDLVAAWNTTEVETRIGATSMTPDEATIEISVYRESNSWGKLIGVCLKANTSDVYIRTDHGGAWFAPMDALVLLHRETH